MRTQYRTHTKGRGKGKKYPVLGFRSLPNDNIEPIYNDLENNIAYGLNTAQDIHKKRSTLSQAIDKSLHAEITDDINAWQNYPNEYDMIGVDDFDFDQLEKHVHLQKAPRGKLNIGYLYAGEVIPDYSDFSGYVIGKEHIENALNPNNKNDRKYGCYISKGNHVLGAVLMHPYSNSNHKYLYVDRIQSNENYRKDTRGIGKSLLATAVLESIRLGYGGSVKLFALTAAKPFYKKMGMYEEGGGSDNFYFDEKSGKRFLNEFVDGNIF